MARYVFVYLLIAAAAVLVPSVASSQENPVDSVMEAILHDWGSIHPGDSRTRLEKLFTPDGGLSAVTDRTYISIRCPYVKVDVKLRKVGSDEGGRDGYVVVSMSKLYLDYPHLS